MKYETVCNTHCYTFRNITDSKCAKEISEAATERYKKFSYRRGIALRAVSVKTVLNVAQIFVELYLMSWPCITRMTFKVIQGNWK